MLRIIAALAGPNAVSFIQTSGDGLCNGSPPCMTTDLRMHLSENSHALDIDLSSVAPKIEYTKIDLFMLSLFRCWQLDC